MRFSLPPFLINFLHSTFKLYELMNPILESFKELIGHEFSNSPSPFTAWLKPTLLVAEEGKLVFEFTIRHEMTNPFGGLHGGVAAAIIDDIIGATLFSLGEEKRYTTINNVIDYFAVASEGEKIIAETAIIKKGRTIANLQCEIWNADKTKLIARGYSNMLKLDAK